MPNVQVTITDENSPKRPDVAISVYEITGEGEEIPVRDRTVVIREEATTFKVRLESNDTVDREYRFRTFYGDDPAAESLAYSRVQLTEDAKGFPKGLTATFDDSDRVTLRAGESAHQTLRVSISPELAPGNYKIGILAIATSGTVETVEVGDGLVHIVEIEVR